MSGWVTGVSALANRVQCVESGRPAAARFGSARPRVTPVHGGSDQVGGSPSRDQPVRTRPTEKGTPMSATDKIKNAAQEVKGKVKEAAGKATDNERLEAEGKADQAGANIKQAGEDIKDAFKE